MHAQPTVFADRRAAGQALAPAVAELALTDPIVLGLPRGGVPVAYEVADHLGAPLDVLVVRKVGAPGQPELGLGAIGEDGVEVLDTSSMERFGLRRADLEGTIRRETIELRRRVERYRGGRPAIPVEGRDVVIVDDGLATGVTATAGVRVVRQRDPARIVVAVPVGAPSSVRRMRQTADDVVCLEAPEGFAAVGLWYRDFGQTSDQEVVDLLAKTAQPRDA